MKKVLENIDVLTSICTPGHQFILESMIESFRIEGIFITNTKAQAIYSRVNEKLKKHS